MRKPAFCICKNKDSDQMCGNCTADQSPCFCYIVQSTVYFLNPKFQASDHLLTWLYSPVCVRPGCKVLKQWFIISPIHEPK